MSVVQGVGSRTVPKIDGINYLEDTYGLTIEQAR